MLKGLLGKGQQMYAIVGAASTIVERFQGKIPSDLLSALQYAYCGDVGFTKSDRIRVSTEYGGGNYQVGVGVTCDIDINARVFTHSDILRVFCARGNHIHEVVIYPAVGHDLSRRLFTRVLMGLSLFHTEELNRIVTSSSVIGIEDVARELDWDNRVLKTVTFDGIDMLTDHIHKKFYSWYAKKVPDLLEYCAEHEMNELTMDILNTVNKEGVKLGSNQAFRI